MERTEGAERTERTERTGNGTICKIKAENHYRHELKYMISYWQYLQLRSRFRQVMKQIPTQEKMELIRSAAFILTIYRTKHCGKKCSG